MTLPRNYEKEMGEMLVEFRAKCSELNLVNAECTAMESEGEKRYKLVREADRRCGELSRAYNDWRSQELGPAQHRVNEVRSEIQALQAKLLDLQVEFILREGL